MSEKNITPETASEAVDAPDTEADEDTVELTEREEVVNEYIKLIDDLFESRGITIKRDIDTMTYSKDGEDLFTVPYPNDLIMARFYKENDELRRKSNVEFHGLAFEKHLPEQYEKSLDTIPGDIYESFIASWASGKMGAPTTGE